MESIVPTTQSGAELRDEFMTLLITQLQNQDPLEPVNQQDFLSQLAQFSTLESIENLSGSFDSLLHLQELSYGSELIGQTVIFRNAVNDEVTGVVDAVYNDGGSIVAEVNGERVDLENIVGLSTPTDASNLAQSNSAT